MSRYLISGCFYLHGCLSYLWLQTLPLMVLIKKKRYWTKPFDMLHQQPVIIHLQATSCTAFSKPMNQFLTGLQVNIVPKDKKQTSRIGYLLAMVNTSVLEWAKSLHRKCLYVQCSVRRNGHWVPPQILGVGMQ